MLPIRLLSPRVASRLSGLALLLGLLASLAGRSAAVPLPADGAENFRRVLMRDKSLSTDETTAARELAQRRRELREAAAPTQLTSLGEVARALLLTEWGSSDELEAIVPADQVEAALRQPSEEACQRDVQKLLKMAGDNVGDAVAQIAAEIRRDVRLSLLERLEQRTRFYLQNGRPTDRIAAANLITETMSNSRRLDSAETASLTGGTRRSASSSRFLRQRLQALTPDLVKATRDAEPQVQVAAVRALGDVEADPAAAVAALRPLLNSGTNVAVRRATGDALGHMAELVYLQIQTDKSRPLPMLKALGQIFPTAAAGLGDENAEVRRACLNACQRVEASLDDLIGDRKLPVEGLAIYRPMMTVLQKALPDLNKVARDEVADIRIAACHLLETLVLVTQKVRRLEEVPLPAPTPEPTPPEKKPGKGDKKDAGPGLSLRSPAHRPAAPRYSQWATARSDAAERPTSAPLATLGRPTKLTAPGPDRFAESTIRPTAFVARQVDELPVPKAIEVNLKTTIEAMIEGLADRDYRVRLASVDVLETFGDRAAPAIPTLVKTLADPNKFVRWSTARALGRLAPRAIERKEAPDVVRGLVALLNDREDLSVRITAAYALEQYGPAAKETVPTLAHAVNRGDKEYIIAILRTIQGVGTDAAPALPNVAWLLRDRSIASSARVEAANTLGRFGPLAKDQLPTLRQIMVSDPDADVRNAASTAVLAIDRPAR
jgi:HEAT repeat protein